jgi:hypothetical protein
VHCSICDGLVLEMLQNLTAYDLHDKIIRMKGDAELLSLAMGEALYVMETDKLYLELSYPTFEAYLGSPEVSMGRSTAYRLMANYKTYILVLECPTGGTLALVGEAKLDLIRPYVNAENKDELLAMGTSLSKSDLRIELAERFNGGIEIRPYVDWELVADELYKDLFGLDGTCQLPGCKKYQESKRTLKREGWNETK